MNLKVTANEYANGVKTLVEGYKKQCGAILLDGDLTGEQMELFKNMFDFVDVTTKLVVEQATMIQEINEKLDKLLDKED